MRSNELLFDAINCSVQSIVNDTPIDLTIDGEIKSIQNIENGEYRVDYQGSIIAAFALDPTFTYNIGERVYILVPQGDFSQKKIIQGRSSYSSGSAYNALRAMRNFYIDRGPNWASEEWYNVWQEEPEEIGPQGICIGPDNNERGAGANYLSGWKRSEESFAEKDAILEEWSRNYTHLKIQADFKTNLVGSHDEGEYFLRVLFNRKNPVEGQEAYVTFDLGFDAFTGSSPFAFFDYTTQKAYFEIEKESLSGLREVVLMQDGNIIWDMPFKIDENNRYVPDKDNAVKNVNNVFVTRLNITFADKVNLSDSLYYPWIETPYGDTFFTSPTNDRKSLQLIAHLQYGDIDLTEKTELCEVRWFRRKLNGTIESSPINTEKDSHGKKWIDYSGPGWYPIQEIINKTPNLDESGTPAEDYVPEYTIDPETNALNIYETAVPYQWVYKAVITYYQEETDASGRGLGTYRLITLQYATQTIYNNNSIYKLSIDEPYANKLKVIDSNDIRQLDKKIDWYGRWYQQDANNHYNTFFSGEEDIIRNDLIDISDKLALGSLMIMVQCYDPYLIEKSTLDSPPSEEDFREVAVLETTKMRPDSSDIIIDWQCVRKSFNYNAEGHLDLDSKGQNEYVLTPVLHFREGTGSPYFIELFAPDGTPLSAENKMTPKNSMMTDIVLDINNGIHFSIRPDFNREYTENTYKAIVHLLDGYSFESFQEILFSMDGDNGTIGNEWTAVIEPCEYLVTQEEIPFTKKISGRQVPLIVRKRPGTTTIPAQYEQIRNQMNRLFLRPFVTRSGIPLEDIDPLEGYYYRAYWDVRMPGSAEGDGVPYSSFLRLYHAQRNPSTLGNIFQYKATGAGEIQAWETGSAAADDIKVNSKEREKNGLVGYTLYHNEAEAKVPTTSLNEDSKDPFIEENNEAFGAVEVRYFDNEVNGTKASLASCNYRFIVKCQVDILKAQYGYGVDESEFGKQRDNIRSESTFEKVHSIVSYYPVDILFLDNDASTIVDPDEKEVRILQNNIKTNWPTDILYNTRGLFPRQESKPLYFRYGDNGKNCEPYNFTELTQTITRRSDTGEFTGDIEVKWYHEAKPHLNMTEGFNGALATMKNAGPEEFKKYDGWYLRNQVIRVNKYGNIDINGWDGQGLDTNEANGTIFGATFGAGYKGPHTNLFTGVIMGVDKSQPRMNIMGYNPGNSEEQEQYMPYLTGLFGYQEGVQSFGLMENGTAFFGRADGGARINIDGTNAIIYGGVNTVASPSIADPMWNTMRLNLVDLSHATTDPNERFNAIYEPISAQVDGEGQTLIDLNGKSLSDNAVPVSTSIKDGSEQTSLDFSGNYFGFSKDKNTGGLTTLLPTWYSKMWQRAYIKPRGADPYWLDSDFHASVNYEKLTWWKPEVENSGQNKNYRINYFGQSKEDGDPRANPTDVWIQFFHRTAYLYTKDGWTRMEIPENPDKAIEYRVLGPTLSVLENSELTSIVVNGKEVNCQINDIAFYGGKELKTISYETLKANGQAWIDTKITTPTKKNLEDWLLYMEYISNRANNDPTMMSNFGPSRASTTPALEIGQHIDGLMPGLIPYEDFSDVFKNLSIPGNRNLLITYDGTLWAMNGVFMGAVIGSNIIGGRIQGAEMGIGRELGPTATVDLFEKYSDTLCKWETLVPPKTIELNASEQSPWKETHGRGFSVNQKGEVGAYGMKIAGGSIDIGSFHIIGDTTFERLGVTPIDKEEYGHLVQLGKSDFVGRTHFFGNVGIGPNMSKFQSSHYDWRYKGSLTQTGGITVFGGLINLENIDKGGVNFINHQQIEEYTQSSSAESYHAAHGVPTGLEKDFIGKGTSLEQSAVFAIDSRKSLAFYSKTENPEQIDAAAGSDYYGTYAHFWPLSYRTWLEDTSDDPKENEEASKIKAYSYVTMMDQFKYTGDSASSTQIGQGENTYATHFEGSNYFRVSPWGLESQNVFVKVTFQPEKHCIKPQPQSVTSLRTEKGYRGYFGAVARAGYGDGVAPPEDGAIGITSWDQNSIILASDENASIRSRDTFFVQAGLRADLQKSETITEKLYAKNDKGDAILTRTATYFMVRGLGNAEGGSGPNMQYSTIRGYTTGGEIGFMAKPYTTLDLTETEAKEDAEMGIWNATIIPKGNAWSKVQSAMYIGGTQHPDAYFIQTVVAPDGKEGGIHIIAKTSKESSCENGSSNDEEANKPNEIYLNKENIVVSANNGVFLQSLDATLSGFKGNNHTPDYDNCLGITPSQIYIRYNAKGFQLTGDKLELVGYEPDQQEGIYARFA